MGKAIVIYNSRGGNTQKVAEKIAEGLKCECVSKKQIPSLEKYDLVVVGTWVIAGMISFSGSRYLKRISKQAIEGKTFVFFLTAGSPEEINPMANHDTNNPDVVDIKDTIFAKMESILTKRVAITILPEKFYCKGAVRMFKRGKLSGPVEHPTEEDLVHARLFGESLLNFL